MIDLHTHSTHSDGTLSPAELLLLAEQAGLSAVALCDHNTVSGLPEFLDAARGRAIEAVTGVEFSTEYQGTELHIVGLFIPREHFDTVTELLRQMLERKEQSNRDLIRALSAAGIRLDYEAIKAGTPGGLVNRAVIAAEMVRLGHCSTVKEAFKLWLSPSRGFFCPPKRLDVFEVIRFIRSIGAVSVLAHPFLNLDEASLRLFLEEAVGCGLDAMETHYATFTPAQTEAACRIAEEFGIRKSGGSDFHGGNKPDIRIGCGRGDLRVPRVFLEDLRKSRHHNRFP